MIYEELASKVAKFGECWIWEGARMRSGYGSVRFEGRNRVVHHVTWERVYGQVPDGMDLDHLCRNRLCCNPGHLEAVTRQENLRRGALGFALTGMCRSGRHAITEDNLYVAPNGDRECRECKRENRRRNYVKTSVATRPKASARTHCPSGHPYDEQNTYIRPNGHRSCRACRKRHRTGERPD